VNTGAQHGGHEAIEHAKVRKGGKQECEKRIESPKEGDAAQWPRRQRRQGEESKAGDCHRAVRSPKKRREGSEKAREQAIVLAAQVEIARSGRFRPTLNF
jgi:hypothetical protein